MYFLRQYKERKDARTVLALCFFLERERYHHWRIYASGMDGVCIEFDGHQLLSELEANCSVLHSQVRYRKVPDIRQSPPDLEELPFLKRYAYEDEKEYRVVYLDAEQVLNKRDCKIDISCISKIVLSPWIPRELADSLKQILRTIDDCARLQIQRSTLVENEEWKKFAVAAPSREMDILENSLTALNHAIMFLAIAAGGDQTATTYAHEEADQVHEYLSQLGENHFWENRELGDRLRRNTDLVIQFAHALRDEEPVHMLDMRKRIDEDGPFESAAGDGHLAQRCAAVDAALRQLARGADRTGSKLTTDVLNTLRSV